MPDILIIIPVAAMVLPGLLTFGLVYALKSLWPAVVLGLVGLGSGLFFLSRASGADWDDGGALNNLVAFFGVSVPALVSVLIGGALAYRRSAKSGATKAGRRG